MPSSGSRSRPPATVSLPQRNFDPLTDRLTSILAGNSNAVGYLFNAAAPCGVTQSGCPAATPYSGRAEPSSFLEEAALLLSGAERGMPHAVSAVNGTITSSFTYDLNGNQVGGLNRSVSYYSFNMPSAITQGSSSNTLFFQYDTDHAR
jgi:hypothetical protein